MSYCFVALPLNFNIQHDLYGVQLIALPFPLLKLRQICSRKCSNVLYVFSDFV